MPSPKRRTSCSLAEGEGLGRHKRAGEFAAFPELPDAIMMVTTPTVTAIAAIPAWMAQTRRSRWSMSARIITFRWEFARRQHRD